MLSGPLAQTVWSFLPNILVALVLGGLIGFERWLNHKVAGVRTHMIIAVTACLITVCGVMIANATTGTSSATDATRLAHGMLAGIGFVGAGVILRRGITTQGVTTAATILLAASVGIAAGFGFFALAIASTIILMISAYLVDRLMPTYDTGGHTVEVCCPAEKFAEARGLLGKGCRIDSIIKRQGNIEFRAHTELSTPELEKVLESIVNSEDIVSIRLIHGDQISD